MTNPTPPSEQPRGTVLIHPDHDPEWRFATRMIRTDNGGWVQASGESTTLGPTQVYEQLADVMLADWPEQSIADWREATREMQ